MIEAARIGRLATEVPGEGPLARPVRVVRRERLVSAPKADGALKAEAGWADEKLAASRYVEGAGAIRVAEDVS